MLEKTKYHFFWNGTFSNWYISHFTIDEVKFNCGEQYMMYMKAKLFGDYNMMEVIINEPTPRKQKELGRLVSGFDKNEWDEVKFDTVKRGLRQKFLQNPSLLNSLLSHAGQVLVEASPYDRVWGIGFNEADALANMDKWGENLLGKILTELSEELG